MVNVTIYSIHGSYGYVSSQRICRKACCAAAQVVGSGRGRIGAVEEGTLPGDCSDGLPRRFCVDTVTVSVPVLY